MSPNVAMDFELFRHHQRGYAIGIDAAKPASKIVRLRQLPRADRLVLSDLHRAAAPRARIAVFTNDAVAFVLGHWALPTW
jgi:hypothetical protein